MRYTSGGCVTDCPDRLLPDCKIRSLRLVAEHLENILLVHHNLNLGNGSRGDVGERPADLLLDAEFRVGEKTLQDGNDSKVDDMLEE